MVSDRSSTRARHLPWVLASSLALLSPGIASAQDAEAGEEVTPPAAAEPFAIDPEEIVPHAGAPVLTLEEAVRRASGDAGSPQIAVLREQLEQANVNVRRAWSALLPIVDSTFAYTRNSVGAVVAFPDFTAGLSEQPLPDGSTIFVPNEVMEVDIQPENMYTAQISASMPLLAMPAYYGIASANQAVDATEKSITFARNEVIFGLTQAYYGAVASRRLIEVSAAQLASAREQERVARARFDVGEIPKVDWLRTAVQRSTFEQNLVRAQNAYVSAKLAIAALIGGDENFDVEQPGTVEPPAGSVDDLVNAALEGRKDLAAQRDLVEIAERSVRAAYWQFAPVIGLNGNWYWANFGGFTGENSTWAVTVAATFTIFDWNRYADIDLAKSQLAQSQAQRRELARTVVQEVKSALLELESARANLISAQESARLAEEGATLVRAQYDAGAATYLDVIDAAASEFRSSVAVVTEELNTQLASLRLARAIGKFGAERFP